MDKSAKKVKSKFTQELLEFLDTQLRDKPKLSYRGLSDIILDKFGMTISKASISKRAKVLSLGRQRGRRQIASKAAARRPTHSKILDCAGAFFLKGAELETGLLDAVNKLFQVEVDNPQARSVLRLVQRLNAFLLYSSLFELFTAQELSGYRRRGLLYLAEEEVIPGFEEVSQYLQYLTGQNLLVPMTKEVTSRCAEALFLGIEHNGKSFYIDAQARTVWPSTKIPKFFTTSLSKANSYVNNAFIRPSAKKPLILQTAPGYTFLPNEAFNLIHCFDQAYRGGIVKAEIINQEGQSLGAWPDLRPAQKGYFIFPLSPWQYDRLQNIKVIRDFEQFQIGPKRENMAIADANASLFDSQLNGNIGVRVALIKRKNENIGLVTNISRGEERYIRKIAQMYFSDWPDEKIKTFYDLMEEGHEQAARRTQMQFNLKALFSGSEQKSPQDVFRLCIEFLNRYAKNRFFPTEIEKEPLRVMREKFYAQAGYIKIKRTSWDIILQPFGDRPELTETCQFACQKFNQCGLKLHNGKNLHIYLQNNS